MKLSFSRILLMHPETDITVDQWVVINMLYKHNALSQQELGELCFKDAPTITRMIDLLVSKKLVSRTHDINDRRRFIIKLTDEGMSIYHYIFPLVREFRAEAYDGLSNEDLAHLDRTLNRIFENLSKQN
jgi:DNA-binding MarR family transcriptional regulator